MESLGTFLKRGREEAGVTLEQLAERTRIRRESLESLESEDLENLPTDTYVRGFVKQVCRELGLHPREGLVRYETLRERLGPQDEMTWSEERAQVVTGRFRKALEDPERVMRRARGLMRAGVWVGGMVVLAALVWGGVSLVGMLRTGAKERPQVAAVTPEPAAKPGGAAAAKGAEPAVTGPPAALAEDAVPEEVVPEETPQLAAAPENAPDASKGKTTPSAGESGPRKPLVLPIPLEQVRVAVPNPARIIPDEILVTVKPAESIREREQAAKARELAAVPDDADAESAAEEMPVGDEPAATTPEARSEARTPAPEQGASAPAGSPPASAVKQAAAEPAPEKAAPKPAPTQAAAAPVSPMPDLSAPPRPRRPVAGERLRLEIVALRAVDVQVLLDGIGYPRSTSMDAGEVKVWKADSLFVLHASDGGAVRVILSGEDLGIPGNDHERLERLVIRGDR